MPIVYTLIFFALLFYCTCAAPSICNNSYSIKTYNVTCKGGNDGSVNITVSKGTSSFTYDIWDVTTNSSQHVNSLSAGSYSVRIVDTLNCTVSQTIQIFEPKTGITIVYSSTPISCLDNSDGTLYVSASGGAAPYIFNLSTGQQSPTAASYIFKNLAFAQKSSPPLFMYNDSIPAPFSDHSWAVNYTKTYTNVTHSGKYAIAYTPYYYDGIYFQCNGCIDLNLYSGVSLWINGGAGGQILQMAINSGNQSYAPQNVADKTHPYAQLPANQWLHVFYNFSVINYPFEKASGWWIQDASGQKYNSMAIIDDIYLVPIVKGDQFVTAIDADGCVAQQVYGIGVAPAINVTVSTFSPLCHGGFGRLRAVVANGFVPYRYLWLPTYATGPTLHSKATTKYYAEFIFRDSLENNFTDLSNPAVISYDNENVFRGSQSIKYTPAGTGVVLWYRQSGVNISQFLGIEFWMYSDSNISKPLTFALATYDFIQGETTNFVPFDFRILTGWPVIPANKWLKAFYNFSVLPTDIFFNAIWIRAADDSIGPIYMDSIRLILASNTDYDVSRVEFYSLIVTDMNACTTRLDGITLSEPEELHVDATASLARCPSSLDGNFTAFPQGGTLPYSYNWTLFDSNHSFNVLSRTVTGLGAMSGYVQLTDSNNCFAVSPTVWVGQVPAISYSYESQPISCYGSHDGQLSLTANGGTPPYTLSFAPSAFAANYIRVLPEYVYSDDVIAPFNVTLPQDGNLYDNNFTAQSGYYSLSFPNFEFVSFHCDSCFSISEYVGISFWIFAPLPTGADDLSLMVVYGLTQWNNNLGSPPHTVVLNTTGKWLQVSYEMELNSTAIWDTFFILASSAFYPHLRIYVDTIQLIPRWFSNEPRTSGLPAGFDAIFVGGAGSRDMTIVDSNGCTKQFTMSMVDPTPLQLQVVNVDPPKVTTSKDGYIKVLALGGTPPYEYIWEQPGGFEENATKLGVGVYEVTVRDSNGCESNLSVALSTGTVLVGQGLTVTVALSSVVGMCIIVGILALGLLTSKPEYYYEKSPLFCKIIHIGILVGYAAAAVEIAQPTDALCIIFPWLVGVSFVLVYGCLFLKTWRIFCIIRMSKKMLKVNLSNIYICKLLSIYFGFELAFLVAWTIVDPPKPTLVNAVNNEKIMQCSSQHYVIFWFIFLGYKFLWVVFGVVMAIGSRNMVAKFNESREIYYCIYNTVIFAIICIPLQAVLSSIPNAQVIIIVALLVIIYTFTLVALYFDIWVKILVGDDEFNMANIRPRGPLSETEPSKAGLPMGTFRASIAHSAPETSSTLHTCSPRAEFN